MKYLTICVHLIWIFNYFSNLYIYTEEIFTIGVYILLDNFIFQFLFKFFIYFFIILFYTALTLYTRYLCIIYFWYMCVYFFFYICVYVRGRGCHRHDYELHLFLCQIPIPCQFNPLSISKTTSQLANEPSLD